MEKRKIALFGGTFDPIHLGHTAVATHVAEHFNVEKIIFVPAKQSPLKFSSPQASAHDRLKMITLAIAENKKFQVSDCELKRSEPSYTLETVRQFQAEFGSEFSIYWLAGADSIGELWQWYKITELIDECNLSIMYRAGFPIPDFSDFASICSPEHLLKLQNNVIQTPLIDISSTKTREMIATDCDVSKFLCPAVAAYIRGHVLYK